MTRENPGWVVWSLSSLVGGSNDHHSIHPLSLLRSAAVKEGMSLVSTKSSNMGALAKQEDFIMDFFRLKRD